MTFSAISGVIALRSALEGIGIGERTKSSVIRFGFGMRMESPLPLFSDLFLFSWDMIWSPGIREKRKSSGSIWDKRLLDLRGKAGGGPRALAREDSLRITIGTGLWQPMVVESCRARFGTGRGASEMSESVRGNGGRGPVGGSYSEVC